MREERSAPTWRKKKLARHGVMLMHGKGEGQQAWGAGPRKRKRPTRGPYSRGKQEPKQAWEENGPRGKETAGLGCAVPSSWAPATGPRSLGCWGLAMGLFWAKKRT